jgi:hypothetical protein
MGESEMVEVRGAAVAVEVAPLPPLTTPPGGGDGIIIDVNKLPGMPGMMGRRNAENCAAA